MPLYVYVKKALNSVIKLIFYSVEEVGQGFFYELGKREKGGERRGEAVMFEVGM